MNLTQELSPDHGATHATKVKQPGEPGRGTLNTLNGALYLCACGTAWTFTLTGARRCGHCDQRCRRETCPACYNLGLYILQNLRGNR